MKLYEMRPQATSAAHKTDHLAELVLFELPQSPARRLGCRLKAELTRLGQTLIGLAKQAAVPAGGALAVDRDVFSSLVEQAVAAEPLIELIREEVVEAPRAALSSWRRDLCARVPLPRRSRALWEVRSCRSSMPPRPSLMPPRFVREKVFAMSRYDRGDGDDYLNCPMDKEEYDRFVDELVGAERAILRDFERRELFQACQPAEEVARTGHDALRFGALKPIGIIDPRTGRRPWAVVQLRAENRQGTAYNLVGFQTNLTWPEQRRVFRMIPGLEECEFFRYGVMHRNTFIDAPACLDETFALKDDRRIRFAGQITGTEGYTEAIATGLLAAFNTLADLRGLALSPLPVTGALGSLMAYATDPATKDYQPMHVNFGIVPALEHKGKLSKRDKYKLYAKRAAADLDAWCAANASVVDIDS